MINTFKPKSMPNITYDNLPQHLNELRTAVEMDMSKNSRNKQLIDK